MAKTKQIKHSIELTNWEFQTLYIALDAACDSTSDGEDCEAFRKLSDKILRLQKKAMRESGLYAGWGK
jgi:hypothetical protein